MTATWYCNLRNCRLNPLCTNGFFLFVRYNQFGLVNCIYGGVTGNYISFIEKAIENVLSCAFCDISSGSSLSEYTEPLVSSLYNYGLFLLVYTINLGWPIVYIKGSQGIISKLY